MFGSESVSACLIFLCMSSPESVRRILDLGSASDLDILRRGLLRDITRFAGAVKREVSAVNNYLHEPGGFPRTNQTLGCRKDRPEKVVETVCGVSRELDMLFLIISNRNMSCSDQLATALYELVEGTNLWTRMSAAWRTGYEKRPNLSLDVAFVSSKLTSSGSCSLL
jgi:hypothetical protein